MAKHLTALSVENAKPGTSRREVSDGGRGLYLVIQPSGHKSWAVRFRVNRLPRKLTLPAGLTLHEAREQAAAAIKEAQRGNDPTKAKKIAKQKRQIAEANTFEAIAGKYLDTKPVQALRSVKQKRDILERLVFPIIGTMPIGNIKRSTVTAMLDHIDRHSGPVSADRAFTEVALVLKFHAKRDDDYLYPLLPGMRPSSTQQRDRTLDDNEIRKVWKTGDAFAQFLLLTGARRTEVAGMQWGELEGSDWILPKARNKAGVDLVRPLSATAMALLATLPRHGDYVFGGTKPFKSFSRAAKVIAEASGTKGWTFHDLRRTARTLMSRAGCNSEHSERCLGHAIGNAVRRTYDRFEYKQEKQHVYEMLAAMIDRIVTPPSGNVRPLRRA